MAVARCRFVGLLDGKHVADQELGTPQNRPTSQKIDFFKVRDMDIFMQPQKKKYENDVTSALKMS